jgi:bifunctional enzyme CysN/CysC
MDTLRFVAIGSVDDGKSTLVGRLLYDSKSVFTDQLAAVERASRDRGEGYTNLALLTDGLRAEREQGITIDVAYRYFATPRRKFIIADTPGHTQYTRNMVTGASTADLAIILVDARKGLSEQSRRHALLVSLLGVRHLVVCVNKMDLVEFKQDVFERIRAEFTAFAARLALADVVFIPVSALQGDNVVTRSPETPWYEGSPLLHHLEEVYVASDRNLVDPRFPVQYVILGHRFADGREYRAYAGQVSGGVLRTGDEIMHLPSGLTSRVAAIDWLGKAVDQALPPMSVAVRLSDELDISRGDLLCRPHNAPSAAQEIDVMACWMSDQALRPGMTITVKHTTRTVRALVRDVRYRLDVRTLRREEAVRELNRNDIGRIRLRVTQPLFCDTYLRNRLTGAVMLIEESTNQTAGLGMINEMA